jgi:hypothetical protein
MSVARTDVLPVSPRCLIAAVRDLTLPSTRLAVARFLVAFCFVWPFFNYLLIDPNNFTEINFLPVFLAALLVPEVTLREAWSISLSLPVFAVALLWANPTAPLRLAIGIIPLHFVLNLTRRLRARGQDILPPNLAYRALQVFVAFCILQTIDFQFFPVVPHWLTAALMTILPRYYGVPYDDFGIRGVQGWASEPSGAAVTCIAFSLVAIFQRPGRRWRVLGLFAALTLVNKSVYAMIMLLLLSIGCLATLRRRRYALLAIAPFSAAMLFLFARSSRMADLHSNLLTGGMSSLSNRELARFAQIFLPLMHFPRVYKPPAPFGDFALEPLGLLPLVAAYGSVLGLVWLLHILWRNFPPRRVPLPPLAVVAGLVLLLLSPPDLIPAVVAFAIFSSPKPQRRPAAALIQAKTAAFR